MGKGYELHHRRQLQRILAATELLCLHQGIENTNLADIADESGVTRATIYNYFKAKEDILWAIFFQDMEKFRDHYVMVINENSTTYERYAAYANVLLDLYESDPKFGLFMDLFSALFYKAAGKPDSFWETEMNTIQWKPDMIEQLLTYNFHDGSLKPGLDPDATAASFIYGFLGCLTFTWRNRESLQKFYNMNFLQLSRHQAEALLKQIKNE